MGAHKVKEQKVLVPVAWVEEEVHWLAELDGQTAAYRYVFLVQALIDNRYYYYEKYDQYHSKKYYVERSTFWEPDD